MPGYMYMNLFVNLRISEGFYFSLNGNNILDVIGITESEAGNIPANGYVAARSIAGRTFSGTLKYNF